MSPTAMSPPEEVKTINGGQSWTNVSPTLGFGSGLGSYIAIDPINTDNIYSVAHAWFSRVPTGESIGTQCPFQLRKCTR
jgi:hypothetical protein